MSPVLEQGVNTPDAARAAGVSFRQADHWVRSGVIVPTCASTGSGYARLWSPEDVELLRVGGRLSAALGGRVSLRVLELAVDALKRLPFTWWPETLDVPVSEDVVVTVRLKPAA